MPLDQHQSPAMHGCLEGAPGNRKDCDRSARRSRPGRMMSVSVRCPAPLKVIPEWSLQDFVRVKKLGVGGASAVYQCLTKKSGLPVALKLYFKNKMTVLNVHQVQREVTIHTKLHHPNIIELYGAFEDADHVVLVLEYASQGDLFDLLRNTGGRMKQTDVVRRIMWPFMCGLNYLHSNSIIHRDIKLENTLFAGDGTLKIADFGLSVDTTRELPVTRLGTLDYMSPEVMICPDKRSPQENKDQKQLAYTDKVDSWACGVLAFELLVGCPPFGMSTREGSVKAILWENPKLPQWLPASAANFIQCALTKRAEQRPAVSQLLSHSWIVSHIKGSRAAPFLSSGAWSMSPEGTMVKGSAAQTPATGHSVMTCKPLPRNPLEQADSVQAYKVAQAQQQQAQQQQQAAALAAAAAAQQQQQHSPHHQASAPNRAASPGVNASPLDSPTTSTQSSLPVLHSDRSFGAYTVTSNAWSGSHVSLAAGTTSPAAPMPTTNVPEQRSARGHVVGAQSMPRIIHSSQSFPHPGYQARTAENCVSLLRLEAPQYTLGGFGCSPTADSAPLPHTGQGWTAKDHYAGGLGLGALGGLGGSVELHGAHSPPGNPACAAAGSPFHRTSSTRSHHLQSIDQGGSAPLGVVPRCASAMDTIDPSMTQSDWHRAAWEFNGAGVKAVNGCVEAGSDSPTTYDSLKVSEAMCSTRHESLSPPTMDSPFGFPAHGGGPRCESPNGRGLLGGCSPPMAVDTGVASHTMMSTSTCKRHWGGREFGGVEGMEVGGVHRPHSSQMLGHSGADCQGRRGVGEGPGKGYGAPSNGVAAMCQLGTGSAGMAHFRTPASTQAAALGLQKIPPA